METKFQPIVSCSAKSDSPKYFRNGRKELMLMELMHKTWKVLHFGCRSVIMKMRSLKKKMFQILPPSLIYPKYQRLGTKRWEINPMIQKQSSKPIERLLRYLIDLLIQSATKENSIVVIDPTMLQFPHNSNAQGTLKAQAMKY